MMSRIVFIVAAVSLRRVAAAQQPDPEQLPIRSVQLAENLKDFHERYGKGVLKPGVFVQRAYLDLRRMPAPSR